ncbi:MAG: SPASM domain-containing protein [Candidatus Aminicenantes bacterium]|nr:SPASM domain-containing protein [Candidatus Aminicenantes bacterium]
MPASRSFQIFIKPVGALCNLGCGYCYYLEKAGIPGGTSPSRMPDIVLEEYIVQHIEACPDRDIRFSWHGGEPTLLGLDTFRLIMDFQRRHCPPGRTIFNGIQTNGTLLTENWGRFLADEGFVVGLSLDGPEDVHNRFRKDKKGRSTYKKTMRGYSILRRHGVPTDILCVVNSLNVFHPLNVYSFFREIGANDVSFLPLVTPDPDRREKISEGSVPARAFGQEHSLCIFRETCGDIPVIEHNGDFYSCDHYVDKKHRIGNLIETSLVEMMESPQQRAFGRAKRDSLPAHCRRCEVLDMCNGECPKNRFIRTPDGERGLNFLCEGYLRFFAHCRPFVQDVAAVWKLRDESNLKNPVKSIQK